MREYVVLIVGDADRWWTTMSAQERAAGYASYGDFAKALGERGHEIIGGAELHSTATARSIRPGGGPVTDGPFVESAEQVGGFYQVRTNDLDDLMECCRVLAEIGEGIEVRPVVTDTDRAAALPPAN